MLWDIAKAHTLRITAFRLLASDCVAVTANDTRVYGMVRYGTVELNFSKHYYDYIVKFIYNMVEIAMDGGHLNTSFSNSFRNYYSY